MFGWAVDENDSPLEMGNLTVTGMGEALGGGQASSVWGGGCMRQAVT